MITIKPWSIRFQSSLARRQQVIVQLLLTLFILSLSNTNSLADTNARLSRNAMVYFFHASFNNLQEELEIAVDDNKSGVFIMFSDKDCPWCEKMKVTIMNQVVVQDYYRKHFQVLSIDVRGDTRIIDFDGKEILEKDFAFKRHRVRATPVVMFFDTKGKKTMRYTGIVRNVEEFLWLAEFVVSESYKTTNFTKYKRNKKQQKLPSSNT